MGSARQRTRATGVLGNAARSLATASPWVWAWVLPVTIAAATAAIADARAIEAIVRADDLARQRGDHVLVVAAAEMIEPRSCEALATSSGARTAGAWRQAGTVRLAALPDDATALVDITPGLIPLIGTTADPPTQLLSGAGLSERLGSARRHHFVPDGPGPPLLEIDGVATRTSVLSQLDRSFLAVTAPTATFDACAISYDRLTERDVETALVVLADAPIADNLTVGTASGIPIDRIADPAAQLRQRSTSRLVLTTAALCFLVGAFVAFFRRKELIVLAICGWSRLARILQTTVECLVLSIIPLTVTVVATHFAVPELAPEATTTLALRTGILAAAAATFGSLLPVATQRLRTTLATMRE